MEVMHITRQSFSSLLSLEDIAITFLFVYMKLSNNYYGDDISELLFSYVDLMFICYFLLRLLFQFGRISAYNFVIIAIEMAACFESVLGILQIMGLLDSNNSIFTCTGTFDSPGPLGGFLAVIISISMAVIFEKKVRNDKTHSLFFDKLILKMSYVSIALCSILLPSTQSRAALLSIIAASLIYLIKDSKIRNWIFHHWLLFTIIIIILSSFVVFFKRPSMNGRLITYKIEIKAIQRNGYKGVGLGHFSNAYGKMQRDYFSNKISICNGELKYCESDKERIFADNPKVGFNDYLQFGIEFGVGPLFLLLMLVLLIGFRLYKCHSPFCQGMISLLVFALFSYPFSLWEFRMLFIVFAAYAGSQNKLKVIPRGDSLLFALIYLIPFSIFIRSIVVVRNIYQYETRWREERFIFGNGDYMSYEYCCSQLYPIMKSNCAFLYEYAYSMFMNGNLIESEKIANQSLALNGNSLTFILLGDIHKEQGLIKEAEKDYLDSFLALPDRLYPLYKLAVLYHDSNQIINYQNLVRSIDDFHPRIESQATKEIRELLNDILDTNETTM